METYQSRLASVADIDVFVDIASGPRTHEEIHPTRTAAMLASTKTTPRRPNPHDWRLLNNHDPRPYCVRMDRRLQKFRFLFILVVSM